MSREQYADAIIRYGLHLLAFNAGIVLITLVGHDDVYLYAGAINLAFVLAGLLNLRREPNAIR